jgi:hypothetical protein
MRQRKPVFHPEEEMKAIARPSAAFAAAAAA